MDFKKSVKIILIFILLILPMVLYAQKDVTQFLGIPVDGSKSEMIQKLKAKGFTISLYDKNVLEGEFNGTEVIVHIVTTNNMVSRIMVSDVNAIGETDIRIRFNHLCQQFLNNKRYVSASLSESNYTIPEDEDISQEMFILERYSKKPVWFMINEFYGEYYIIMFYDNEYNRANGEDL